MDAEFPHLYSLGLYAAPIQGDGNCLFNSLSDQLYGTESKHPEIRARVVEYMADKRDYFAGFLDVLPGGTSGPIRRNPKRKNAGGYSTFNTAIPTPEDVNKAFDAHLERMAQGGTWGDNMEIVAFSGAYNVNVVIFQRDTHYMVRGPGNQTDRATCCVAFHLWEHYSSVRYRDSTPGTPAQIDLKDLPYQQIQFDGSAFNAGPIPDHDIDIVLRSLYFPLSRAVAIKALEACRGNVNNAVDRLMEDHEADSNRSSSMRSSSVEPDYDSDDNYSGPKKRQNRRMSRATKSALRQREQMTNIAARLTESNDSLDSLINATSEYPTKERRQSRITIDSDDEDEDMSPPPLQDGETSSGSDYAAQDVNPLPLKIKLKLGNGSSDSSQAANKPTNKPGPSKKRLESARDVKTMKKRAQKAAARERKLNNSPRKPSTLSSSQSSSHPTMTTGLRVLHI